MIDGGSMILKKNGNKNTPLVIGLTGQTGAGKSTVTQSFAEKGFVIIDCDQLTRELQSRKEILTKQNKRFKERRFC